MRGEREAVYVEKKEDRRIISAPNGLWQAQRRVSHTPGSKKGEVAVKYDWGWGYRLREKGEDAPHFDPWENLGKPQAKELAWMAAQ